MLKHKTHLITGLTGLGTVAPGGVAVPGNAQEMSTAVQVGDADPAPTCETCTEAADFQPMLSRIRCHFPA